MLSATKLFHDKWETAWDSVVQSELFHQLVYPDSEFALDAVGVFRDCRFPKLEHIFVISVTSLIELSVVLVQCILTLKFLLLGDVGAQFLTWSLFLRLHFCLLFIIILFFKYS